ncbi:hypothetical protein E1265_32320 [Streptomyces sp. 8K308]|uniref:hypothetical protein n=1 Tax=Streptomyces sp. 8K308 TaxID=2530388 RepID=UPI00104EEB8D|nr:hypothetical protein [Streptomyces sp. 8K308]TDC09385.1 hypothetical protein E1265_32320 [Streptomyces sp. 8K308]
MRRTIRLALPVFAVATALVLSGCKSGRGGGSSSGDSGGSGSTGGQHDGDDDVDIDVTTGGSSGGTSGGGNTTGGGNGRLTLEQLEGDWYTGVDPSASNLEIRNGEVTFYEDFDVEGDICQGTISDGRLTLTSCDQYGTQTWNEGTAALVMDGDVLHVSWSSGTMMEMRNIHTPGAFTDAEMAELEATIDRMNNM